ncbi:trichohyalin-like isoform X4 [Brienomyrus brachyistius]|uniref:trichohyalin-like isoform X4 n=1 Tax=Brienomyrus brachyistius TaxID=42636 RepID=UPI0020B3F9FB|nr:trichohyalin-like isoform X4 [Brienomyrus brachyistius]
MAAQVEVKSVQGETAGVSSGHLRRTAEPPSGTQGHIFLSPQAGKPALLTPKPFSLEKTLSIRPILPPKPQVPSAPPGASQTSDLKSSELSLADSPGVLGGDQTRSMKSNTPTAPKPALHRNPEINPPTVVIHDLSSTLQSSLLWNSKSNLLSKPKLDLTESSISVPLNAPKANLSTTPKPDDPSTPKPTPPHTPKPDLSSVPKPVPLSTPNLNLSKSEVFASPEPLANQATSIDSPEKPRKLSVLERIKMLSQFRTSQESSASECSGMTQTERQPRMRMGAPISRAKSMGSLDYARWEALKDMTEEEQSREEKSSVSPLLQRNIVVVQPATPQSAGSPHKVAAPRKTGATGQLSELTSRFESLNTPDKCQPDKENILERKGKEVRCTEEVTESQPSENADNSLRQMMPEWRKQDTDQEETASSIKKRISLLFDPSSAQGGGVSTPLEVEPHSSAQPIQEVDISVGVKQRIKQLIAESPSQSLIQRKVKPRPLSQDLTKCFSPGMSMDTSPSTVGLERVQMRGVDKKEREAHEKVEDPMADSSIKGQDQSGGSFTTLDQSGNGGTELELQELQSNKEKAPVETPENVVSIIPSLQLGHLDRSAVSEGILSAQLEEKTSKLEEERQKQMELERKCEEERQKQLEQERKLEEERQKQLELERKREEERQKQLELERKLEEERQKQLEQERKREEERQKQLEQERKREEERQKQLEQERKREEERQKQLEQERKREEERQKQLELERKREEERQKQLEQERKLEEERQKQLELERKREEERQKQLELERKREEERQKQLEQERKLEEERQKQLELERKREEERQKQLEQERKREEERQKQLERKREEERQKQLELERKREEERQKQLEQERKLEEERQKQLERKREEERQKQLELERKREEERQKQLEQERKLEEERQRQLEQERKLEEERQRQLEQERKLEEERQRQLEQERKLEEERQKQLELERKRKEERQKQLEQERKLEEEKQKQLEQERKREEERQKQLELERKRKEERQKQLELERKQEEERQKQLEQERKQEEERQKQLEKKREEERQKQLEQERKLEEQKQLELERKREEERQKQLELDRKNQEREVEESPQQISTAGEILPTSQASSSTLTEQSVREGDENATTEEVIFDDFSVRPMRWRYMRKSSLLYGDTFQTSQPPADAYDEGGKNENYVENLNDQEQQGEISEDDEKLQKKVKIGIDRGHDGQGGVKQEDTKSQGGTEIEILDPIKQPSNRSSHLCPGEKLEAEEDRCSAPRQAATQPLPKPATCIARTLAGTGPREEDGTQDRLISHEDDQYGSLDAAQHPGEGSLTPNTSTPTDALPEPSTPGGLPSPSTLSSVSCEATDPLPFPETPTSLLDSSALRSRVLLGKRRSQRALPSRAARQKAVQDAKDPKFQDSAGTGSEMTAQEDVEDEEEEEEEEEVKAEPCLTPSQPQRVPLFPGMDTSALKAQLKKRVGDSENQAEQPPPQRSAKSPFLPQATRVLPPIADKENRDHSSPQWLQELKSKKRFSQHESDT